VIAAPHELLEELRAQGLVAPGEDVALDDEGPERPWFISLLLGVAGWVAGIFVLLIVAMMFKSGNSGTAFVVGLVLLGMAWGLFLSDRQGAFLSQLALALSIAGQFLLVFGLGETFMKGSSRSVAPIAFIALVMQAGLVFLMPNALHRTMSALFACAAWAVFVRYGLWDHSQPWSGSQGAGPSYGLALFGWMVAWLPVAGVLYLIVHREPAWMAAGRQAIVRPAAVGIIVGLAVTTLLSQPFDSFPFTDAARAGRAGLSLWPLLSAFAALGALCAAFALGSRGLAWICIAAALLHLSHFYYAMGTSLLVKSVTMIALGAALLYMARALRRS
jgi:hypothetical protein